MRSAVMLALFALFVPFAHAQTPVSPDAAGIWEGHLDFSGGSLRVVLHIQKSADGALTATLDSPDQGATGIAVSKIEFVAGVLRFESTLLQAQYEGKMSDNGAEIAGDFVQRGVKLALTLARTDKPSELVRPQNPKKPYPYREEEVAYENTIGGSKLAGSLTLPTGDGPFAAALLITGSGAQDRDETLMGHKPFLVLADHLTRLGIAVLRVDDRGIGGSTGDMKNATSEDFAGDVRAGIEFLKGRKEIDPKRIGLIGHSEGGLIAPMVAAKSADVSFIVLLSGPGVTGEEILYAQGERILRAGGAPAEFIQSQHATQAALFAIVKAEPDMEKAVKKCMDCLFAEFDKLPEAQKKAAGDQHAVIEGQARAVSSPWFRFFLTYDARTALRGVHCPVLALNGELDLQVPHDQNLPEIVKALEAGGCADFTVVKLPRLNHLFQNAKTGGPEEYGRIAETMAPLALHTVSDWILSRTAKSAK